MATIRPRSKFKLRPYQDAADAAVTEHMAAGHRVCLVSPTGSGKTAMGVAMANAAVARGERVLWIAHRRELVSQASEQLDAAGCVDHGVVQAGTDRSRPMSPVQVASIQTLVARDECPPADLVVWDECHHCAADTYVSVRLSYPKAKHLGLTATPERGDGSTLEDAFDTIIVAASVAELTALGHLVPCHVLAPSDLGKDLAKDPLNAWQRYTPGRPTVVFATSVAHSIDIVRAFRTAGVDAEHLDGETPLPERESIIQRFMDGRTTVLSNVYVLTEGFDAPRAEVCLIARGASTASTFIQMTGRVLRPHEGKTGAVVIDLRGVVHRHGLPDDDRTYCLSGKAIRRVKAGKIVACPMCSTVGRHSDECPRCSYVPSVSERELGLIAAPATFAQKVAAFTSYVETARRRNYSPDWPAHRFRAAHNHWPVDMPQAVK